MMARRSPAILSPQRWLLVAVLWLAFGLRVTALTELPPGLTHDEANHGREALEVIGGARPYFFPYNYGSEPLYSYTVAGFQALTGKGVFSLRLVNVFMGLLAIAGTYAWGRAALKSRPDPGPGPNPDPDPDPNRWLPLTAALFLAISFWPLASSREALRAGMLPFLTTLAMLCLWRLTVPRPGTDGPGHRLLLTLGLALALVAGLHNYLAARVWWLVVPLFLLYLVAAHRPVAQRLWRVLVAGLGLTALLAGPMFLYLDRHPEMQPRLQMLDGTLQALRSGDLGPALGNAWDALQAFTVPGAGDRFLAYNIPGRPVFDPLTGLFFWLGLALAFWRWRRPAYALLLLWFWVGIGPSLLTGPTANTTRNLAALPAIYLLLALGFVTAWSSAADGLARLTGRGRARPLVAVAALAWAAVVGGRAATDYFVRWGQDPAVRAAYQVNLMAAIASLDTSGSLVLSTVYPGAAHDISVAMTALGRPSLAWRGVDARSALIFPRGRAATAVIPTSTPPHPAFAGWLAAETATTLRPDDLDPGFTLYQLFPAGLPAPDLQLPFGGALTLLAGVWRGNPVRPGEVAEFVTFWRVDDPNRVGPPVLPAWRPDVNLFTHVLRPDGTILVQDDALDAPSWSWQTGDLVVQVHRLPVPPDTPAGVYPAVVGVYDRASGDRLPVEDPARPDATTAPVSPLRVEAPGAALSVSRSGRLRPAPRLAVLAPMTGDFGPPRVRFNVVPMLAATDGPGKINDTWDARAGDAGGSAAGVRPRARFLARK